MNREDNYGDELGRKVYDLTWQGKLWGREGAIAMSRLRFFHLESLGRAGDGASAFSSTYYTAWGNAFAKVWQAPIMLRMLWLARGNWCAIWALSWSNFAEKTIGLDKMTHGQLDIRASILAKWGFYKKAERCLMIALKKENLTTDSRALIHCKLGEIYNKLKLHYLAEAMYLKVNINELTPTTEVRVLKSLGSHYLLWNNMNMGGHYLRRALELAEKQNLGDQVVKIKALMKKVK